MNNPTPPSVPVREAGTTRPGDVAGRDGASERILLAATELFKTRGYHGTSMRQLASAVNIEAASLYYHFSSKQHILAALFDHIMNDLHAGLDEALASSTDVLEQLHAVVRVHVLLHIARQDEAFISHSELRSLTPENRARIIGKRDSYERKLRALLGRGIEEGKFHVADARVTSTAVLMMCSGVSDWYVEGGRLDPETVVACYSDMVKRLVGA